MAMEAGEQFNPRLAALTYAANVERVAMQEGDQTASEAVHALTCALVYIGDAITRQNALMAVLAPGAVDNETAQEIAEQANMVLGRRDG